jgi:hypothetical protein
MDYGFMFKSPPYFVEVPVIFIHGLCCLACSATSAVSEIQLLIKTLSVLQFGCASHIYPWFPHYMC